MSGFMAPGDLTIGTVIRRVLLLVVLAIFGVVVYEWVTFPDVRPLASAFPKTTAFMDIRRDELRAAGKDDTLAYTPVPYDRISPYLRRGVLVAEDNDFYEHEGVDTKAMREALERDWKRKKVTQGGSTITQQLAKNLYLSPSRNPLRKVKEYFLARALERHLTKKRILELYLNVVEMGERVYGAEAAAEFYFHESAAALSPQQAALLAGCLPNPRLMNPAAPSKRLRARERMVLSRHKRWGYVAETEVLAQKKPDETPAAETSTTDTTATTTDTAARTSTTTPSDTATTDVTQTQTTSTTGTAPPTDTVPTTATTATEPPP
jgi:monofunctional biosynthetic peptidoglycan transglycosylase